MGTRRAGEDKRRPEVSPVRVPIPVRSPRHALKPARAGKPSAPAFCTSTSVLEFQKLLHRLKRLVQRPLKGAAGLRKRRGQSRIAELVGIGSSAARSTSRILALQNLRDLVWANVFSRRRRGSLELGFPAGGIMTGKPKTVVLVHGGFVDGSGWEGVYSILRKHGYPVSIVQNPTTSLADDVATLGGSSPRHWPGHSRRALLRGRRRHRSGERSQGGGARVHHGLRSGPGRVGGYPRQRPSAGGAGPPILPPQDGFLFLDREKFPASFAGDVEADKAAFMADSQVPWESRR